MGDLHPHIAKRQRLHSHRDGSLADGTTGSLAKHQEDTHTMKRDLTFVGSGQLPEALGILPARCQIIEHEVADMIDANASIRQVLEHFNNHRDLTDAEWTSMVFALGYYEGMNRHLGYEHKPR